MCELCGQLRPTDENMIEKAARLGLFAFSKYLDGQESVAAVTMEMVYQTCGREGVYGVTLAWCDYILERTPGYRRGGAVRLVWEELATGEIKHAEEAPPMVRWAGQMLAARAADDEMSTAALFDAVSEESLAEYVAALLQTLTTQLRVFKEEGST